MNPHRYHAPACLLLLLTFFTPLFAEQWTEVRSPNFAVITDAGEKRGRDAALRFEQIRAAFAVVFEKIKVSTPIPVQIVAFRNNKELRRFAPLWKGKPIELAGFYVPGEDRQFIAVDMSSEENWGVVFHEFSHLLLHANLPPIPVWFDEGFAEYFASLKVEKGQIYYGGVLESTSYVLSNTRWMKTEQLFSIQHDSPEYNEHGDHRSMLYAESWLVVHYLESRDKMKQASTYLDLVQTQHVPIPDAIQRAFGMTPAQFDKALHDYYDGRGKLYHVDAPPVAPETSYTSRPLSDADAESALADLHLHESDYIDQATIEFQQVLQKQPANAIALRGLGYACFRKGNYPEAERNLKAAVATNTADSRTHYLYAMLLARKVSQSSAPPSEDNDLPNLKKESQAAIALDPEFADAYNLLAFAHARQGDFQEAIDAESKAFRLNPHNELYVLNLAQYYAGTRNWSEAERLLKVLQNSPNPSVAGNARENLQYVERARNFETARREQPENPSEATPAAQSFQPGEPTENVKSASSPPSSEPPIQFLKGKLLRIDCSAAPVATLTILANGKTWIMTAQDKSKLIVIGADALSCDWQNRKVATNYRGKGDGQGELVSLELQ
jgi:Flp pilus assembly protein TadD